MKQLVIFGNGEIAELAHYYFSTDSEYKVEGFTVDAEYLETESFCGLPITPFEKLPKSHPPEKVDLFIALSYAKLNRVRQAKFERARGMGYKLATYISSKSACAENVSFGENCLVLENQTVQPFCRIGDNVTLWSGNHIGHHSTVGDHSFVSSHVVISGLCTIGQRCFIGVNSTIRDNCVIGDEVMIGMGAKITANLNAGAVVLANADEPLDAEDRRARAIKRSYFGVSR